MIESNERTAQRKTLIQQYHQLIKRRNGLYGDYQKDQSPDITKEGIAVNEDLNNVRDDYRSLLEKVPVSRCPYTGSLVLYKIDTMGLDGLWWNNNDPVREPLPEMKTLFALDGAMEIKDRDLTSEFPVIIGPDAPFVIPEKLGLPEMKAVIHPMILGGQKVWWIAYFMYPDLMEVEGINDYASDSYTTRLTNGLKRVYTSNYSERDYDFDLEKWMRRGKLLWIGMDDPSMKLHASPEGCPFLNVRGDQRIQLIDRDGVSNLYGEKVTLEHEDSELADQLMADIRRVQEGSGDR